MKKRLLILFSITIIIVLYIIFFMKSKYLGIYDNEISIIKEYEKNQDYSWSYSLDNKIVDINDKDSGNTYSLSIKALEDGKCVLKLLYNSDTDTKYEIIYGLTIKEDKIYWTYGESKGLVDLPNPQ